MKIRVGSYNMNEGGRGNGGLARLDRQLALIHDQNLDLFGLQEGKWWDRDHWELFHYARTALGMWGCLVRARRHGCHLAMFVRESAKLRVVGERHERRHPYWHALGHLELAVAEVQTRLQFIDCHLAPSSPELRRAEAETFGLWKDQAVIAVGDFNDVPIGGHLPARAGVDDRHRAAKGDTRSAEALQNAGLIDVGAALSGGAGQAATVGHRPGTLTHACDRVYVSDTPLLRPTSFTVLSDLAADSDHLPVVAEVQIGEAK